MAVTYSFVDGAIYGTEDINDIARSLIGAGVMPFTKKDSYNVSDINEITSSLVSDGVQLGGCKVTVKNIGEESMSAEVAQGIVFFDSGVRLEVDSDGCTVSVEPNCEGYVIAQLNTSLQTAEIVFSAELPTDGEYVILARISASGEVIDKRSFARSKVATLGQNITQKVEITKGTPEGVVAMGSNIYGYIENVNFSHCNYILLDNLDESGTAKGRAIFSIKENLLWLAVSNIHPGASIRYAYYGNMFNSSCFVQVIGDKIVFSSNGTTFSYPEITFI